MTEPLPRLLPDDREAITHKFDIAGYEGYITVGLFEDRTPGEIYLVMAKEGSTSLGLPMRLPGPFPFVSSTGCHSQYSSTTSKVFVSSLQGRPVTRR